jgi:predicted ABC-type ATPase
MLKYLQFIFERNSTDPIPELNDSGKLGIILLGIPGSGKSTFAQSYIKRKMKKFSTDDVSLEFTGDVKKYYPEASEINLNRLSGWIKKGGDFIYDATGKQEESVSRIYNEAKSLQYKVIFILILIDKETAIKQNIRRGRIGGHETDVEYIEEVYNKQLETTKNYLKLNPDGFYVVLSKSQDTPLSDFPAIKYKFMKFDKEGILMRRRKNNYEYR